MPALKLIERGFFKSPAIKLSAGLPSSVNPPVQILRVGKFNHPQYGEFEITPKTLQEMKSNFDNRVRGVDVAFDYFHDSDKEASGWPTELYLSEDGNELWAIVDWTPAAQKKLAEREIRYFSPDFAFQWQDPETNAVYNNVLFGGGLTNRPFVKDMAAIVAHETKGDIMTAEELKALQAQIVKLSEDVKKVGDENAQLKKKLDEVPAPEADDKDEDDLPSLKKKLAEMAAKCAEYAEANKKLLAEKEAAQSEKKMAEKETAFNLLLTEGKACAAQKESFIKDDMVTFIKLAQPLNLEGKGTASGNAGTNSGDREEQVLKLAEKMHKEDPSIPLHKAIQLANKQVK